jgi:hypothetical protein
MLIADGSNVARELLRCKVYTIILTCKYRTIYKLCKHHATIMPHANIMPNNYSLVSLI